MSRLCQRAATACHKTSNAMIRYSHRYLLFCFVSPRTPAGLSNQGSFPPPASDYNSASTGGGLGPVCCAPVEKLAYGMRMYVTWYPDNFFRL
jgi:hypothetical protein